LPPLRAFNPAGAAAFCSLNVLERPAKFRYLLMVGPPGAGKSMLAARLPTILPPLAPSELLGIR
jgi:ABC-type cobalamin transport system ATPase subunit